jgi:hypothetical protein
LRLRGQETVKLFRVEQAVGSGNELNKKWQTNDYYTKEQYGREIRENGKQTVTLANFRAASTLSWANDPFRVVRVFRGLRFTVSPVSMGKLQSAAWLNHKIARRPGIRRARSAAR